jgi:lipoate-protein ligase A
MLSVAAIVQSDLEPGASYTTDRALVDSVRRRDREAVLRVFAFRDAAVALGRYHVAPSLAPHPPVALHRRLSGGRVAALGPGFVAITLVLPHRSALIGADPLALRPEQALNRCVRALLAALRGLGVDAFYPGRDLVTIDRRLLGVVGLECEASDVAVFEAVLALQADWSDLSDWVEAVDPNGILAAERLRADRVTSLARHGLQKLSLDELAHCVGGALAREYGVAVTAAALGEGELVAAGRDAPHESWVAERLPRPELGRHGVSWGQLGVFEAYLKSDDEGRIGDVMLAGDFIADSPAVAELETRLRGCLFQGESVAKVVDMVFANPRHFLLGVGSLETVTATIMGAK